jgi:hypothetical protein
LHKFLHNNADRIVAIQLLVSDYQAHLAVQLFIEGIGGFLESGKSGLEQLFVKSYCTKQLVCCGIFELFLVVVDYALFDLLQFVLEFYLDLLQVLD